MLFKKLFSLIVLFDFFQPLSYAYNSTKTSNPQPLTRYRFDYDRQQSQPLSSGNIAADASYDKGERSLPYYADRSNYYSAYDGGGTGGGYLDYLGKR